MRPLFSCLFGSKLYGTSTPTSDRDLKVVYLPSLDSLLLNEKQENIVNKTNKEANTRNGADDVDEELIPLHVFCRDLVRGQTYALELAYAVESDQAEQAFYSHTTGAEINRADSLFYSMVVALRSRFITSTISSMMGYVVNQANIYSFKGERLNCAREFRELLISLWTDPDAGDDRLGDSLPDPDMGLYKESLGSNSERLLAHGSASKTVPNSYEEFYGEELGKQVRIKRDEALAKFKALEAKYPKYFAVAEYDIGGNRMRPCFKVLEKTFPWANTLDQSVKVVNTLINKYGARANEATETNVDWKAMMHAVRICDEGISLLSGKGLSFPFQQGQVDRYLSIRRNEVPLDEVRNELDVKLEQLKTLELTSTFPKRTEALTNQLEEFMLYYLRQFYGITQ